MLPLGLALFFALLLFNPDQPDNYNRYLTPGGKDSYVCNITAKSCATIQGALDVVVTGDEIDIAGGTYTRSAEAVVAITKAITLSGGWDTVFLHQKRTYRSCKGSGSHPI